jgi:1-phosphofructokinase family hexose kinase
MIVAVALSPALDRTLVVDSLNPGSIHRPLQIVEVAGGKGFNVTRAAHRLGADVMGAGIVGGHTGSLIVDLLHHEGITVHAVPGRQRTRTCTSIASLDTGELTEIYEPATDVTAEEWAVLGDEVDRLIAARAGWMTVSGSLPGSVRTAEFTRLLDRARHHGFALAVDTQGTFLRTALAVGADLIKINVSEARGALADTAGPDALAWRMHHEFKIPTVIVTAGVDGAYAASRGRLLHMSVVRRGACPVGSGDCFLAALVTAFDRNDDIETALALAGSAAIANALTPGAAVFDANLCAQLFETARAAVTEPRA